MRKWKMNKMGREFISRLILAWNQTESHYGGSLINEIYVLTGWNAEGLAHVVD